MVIQVNQLSAEQFAQEELFDRLNAINERLNTLKIESEEVRLCLFSLSRGPKKSYPLYNVTLKFADKFAATFGP